MLKIVKSTDPIMVERLNLCIYAPPGVGKTTLAFTSAEPLLLDFDKGAHRASNRKDTVPISSWKDVIDIGADDLAPYKTVIADTAGRALDFLTADIIAGDPKKGRGGALTLQGYGDLKAKFSAWLKMLNSFGKDVILIAHMDEQRNGDEVIERLDVQGGSKGEIYKSVDAMGRIFIRDKKRVIDFSPRENSFGKNPCGLDVMEVPDAARAPLFMADLIAGMKAQLNALSEEQKKAQREIEDWLAALEDYTTADDFNRCLDDFRGASVKVKGMVARRAKDLGLIYNKATALYEAPHAVAS